MRSGRSAPFPATGTFGPTVRFRALSSLSAPIWGSRPSPAQGFEVFIVFVYTEKLYDAPKGPTNIIQELT